MDGRWIERKTVRYGATTVSDAQRRYRADAAIYTESGWVVHHLAWEPQAGRPTLVATYARYEGPADLIGVFAEVGKPVVVSPRFQAMAIASVLLTATWLLLFPLGAILGSEMGIDVGVLLLLAGLATWAVVDTVVLRVRGLGDVLSWAVVGLGSPVLPATLMILLTVVLLNLQ